MKDSNNLSERKHRRTDVRDRQRRNAIKHPSEVAEDVINEDRSALPTARGVNNSYRNYYITTDQGQPDSRKHRESSPEGDAPISA